MKTPKPLVLGANVEQPHLPVQYAGKTYKVPLVETIPYTRFISRLRVKYPKINIEDLPEEAKLEALEAFLAYQIPKSLLQAFEDNHATTDLFVQMMEAWGARRTRVRRQKAWGNKQANRPGHKVPR